MCFIQFCSKILVHTEQREFSREQNNRARENARACSRACSSVLEHTSNPKMEARFLILKIGISDFRSRSRPFRMEIPERVHMRSFHTGSPVCRINPDGKCFRLSSSFSDPRISPLTLKYEYPQLSLLIITRVCKPTKQTTQVVSYYSMLMYSNKANACFKHSNFFTVKDASTQSRTT